ncbi:hypothetical protein [Acetobacter okinawensis]
MAFVPVRTALRVNGFAFVTLQAKPATRVVYLGMGEVFMSMPLLQI